MNPTGYAHPAYARSLDSYGEPLELPACQGWVLKRMIPGTPHFDAMGCYPVFACMDWSRLGEDLDHLGKELVALSLVTDPFGNHSPDLLSRSFHDIARPYKEHFVVDLRLRPADHVSAHHRRNARNALKALGVEVCPDPLQYLDEWNALYQNLIQRHQITGLTRFSRESFAAQMQVPGLVAFRALHKGRTVGMLLWYVQGEIGYYHLGAYSPEGYEQNASFAMFWTLLEYFSRAGLRWLSLGAGAGAHGGALDGLTRFKQGWATGTRTAYFCGRIFDRGKYQEIASMSSPRTADYFPAYRAGDFN